MCSDDYNFYAGIQVYPRFINIGPQVTVGYPATPPPAKMSTSPKTGSNGSLTNGAAPTGNTYTLQLLIDSLLD